MQIVRNLKVPTGNILVVEGEKGKLEMLSLGDYGKNVNVKADFLGLTRTPEQVTHTDLLPLEEKWVITISTQYGCREACRFCDVPKVGNGVNATYKDIINQVKIGMSLHPKVTYTDRLNIHFARMGEPSHNLSVLTSAIWFHENLTQTGYKVHPVVSTMMPNSNHALAPFIRTWMSIKNDIYNGNAGLQLSINSTNEQERFQMFNGRSLSLSAISNILKDEVPLGRKITLNFAVADYEINPEVLLDYFNPEHYIIKLTPMHKTAEAIKNDIKTEGDYTTYNPYEHYEEALINAGYDVLVFIASEYEDLGRITCGNAILSGTLPECPYLEVKNNGK